MRDKFIIVFTHIVLCLIVVFTTLSINFHEIFATTITKGLTLDSAMVDMLSEGAYQDSVSFGINMDPDLLVYGIDSIIQDVNNKLYTKYGWDLEDIAWDVEDQLQEPYKKAAAGLITGSQVLGTGYQMFFSSVADKLTGGRDLIVGKVDSITGQIYDVYDNALTYISDNYVDKLTSVRSELIQDDKILDFSSDKIMYSDSFQFSSTFDFSVYNFKFSRPFVLYNSGRTLNNNDTYIGIIVPQTYTVNDFLISAFGIGTSGTKYDFSSVTVQSAPQGSFVINGVQYATLLLDFHYNFGTTSVHTNRIIDFDINDATNFINTYDPYNTIEITRSYDVSDSQLLKTILDSLKGHWVTTDDLKAINEKLDALPIGGVVVDGQTLPVVDTSELAIQELIDLIQEVLDRAALVDEGLSDYTGGADPGPDPDPDPEIPNEIPTWLWPSFIPDLLPEDMFSMFRPVFDIVGSQYSMYGIWIIVPSIIIFVLVVYMIVSLF